MKKPAGKGSYGQNKFFDIASRQLVAKVCKNCGEKFYDDETAKNIEKIVNKLKELTVEVTVVKYKEKIA